ncbi:MAG: hypothetical protein K0S44_1384 [Bacteroidetes bacterium]|nr:hypothetical protein [Bacteroidota bacterium]
MRINTAMCHEDPVSGHGMTFLRKLGSKDAKWQISTSTNR